MAKPLCGECGRPPDNQCAKCRGYVAAAERHRRAIAAAVEAEREACAEIARERADVALEVSDWSGQGVALDIEEALRARAGKETPMSERNPTPRMVADAFESGHARGLADAITRCTALANELGGVWQTVLASFVRAIRRRGEGGS